MERVSIIGAGVSGLTCGVVLAERGYEVTLVADELEPATSAAAAAIWYPYAIEPKKRVHVWAMDSYETFRQLARDPASGVDLIDFHVYSIEQEQPLPDWSVRMNSRQLLPGEIPSPYCHGFTVTVPLIRTPDYLPYLRERLSLAGGKIKRYRVADVSHLGRECALVVNCAGIGAKDLCHDAEVEGGRGVVLVVPNPGIRSARAYPDPKKLTYVIPRRWDCVLGGIDDNGKGWTVNRSLRRNIYERCREMEPRLPPFAEAEPRIETRVGFRPKRSEVRLCYESLGGVHVVHNYGHGGAGFTVSWGCAYEVLSAVRRVLSERPRHADA